MVFHFKLCFKKKKKKVLDSLVFASSNSPAIKIKYLDEHVVKNWIPIKIQFKI